MPNFTHTHRCKFKYHDWECKNKDCYGSPVGSKKPSKTRTCPDCMTILHGEPETHESYGMIELSRFQSSDSRFFGSSIKASGGMSIRIQTAKRIRSLSSDRYHSGTTLIEVNMSHAQFAQLITTPNSSGTPCTLRYVNGKHLKPPPEIAVREQYVNEFETAVKETFATLDEVTGDIAEYFKTGKGSRVEIREKLATVQRALANNAPFILEQFNRGMDQIVTEAKNEVESFTEDKIRALGIKALQSDIEKMLRAPAQSQPLLITTSACPGCQTQGASDQCLPDCSTWDNASS